MPKNGISKVVHTTATKIIKRTILSCEGWELSQWKDGVWKLYTENDAEDCDVEVYVGKDDMISLIALFNECLGGK